ncbi:AsnC family transcriptional regulator [Microbacterium aurum]|uniref:AsnC family transcriptional regulator n=1 Tax=Microbacterium aurum TaxID=36805 RepID=A0A1P8U738_9MICO|nr:Lrp/AsnC family transcriptional regulator [Microbacterium aurum]APZ33928.1 AsnC family transcriptional regulator [Microbacterium aurum]MBM7827689.1 Lrp/AsnC family leucine-responsive transcriptional regulator [Microbacterium aurum]
MDAIDEQILTVLRDNGRASFSAIGRDVGLSTNAVAARVRRLERKQIILGYQAILGTDLPEPVSGLEVFIDVRLHADRTSREFLTWATNDPDILDAAHVTGPYDYLLHVRARDTGALDRLLVRLKSDGGAAQTQTRLALRPQTESQ